MLKPSVDKLVWAAIGAAAAMYLPKLLARRG